MKSKLWKTLVILSLVLIGLFALNLIWFVGSGTANPASPAMPALQADNQACLACHGQPGKTIKLPSGETLYLTIDANTFNNSIHGKKGLACTQCHQDISDYPHPSLQAQDRRDVTIRFNQVCATCHQDQVKAATNNAHQQAREKGNKQAAICTDCHGTHDITTLKEPRSRIPQTCQKCHSQIFNLYKDSVHGSDLIGAGNPNVPSCVDCHGNHNVQGPINSEFRLFSPNICARCHANKTLMAKYNINTDVFSTYLADFHGTTVTLFQDLAPGQQPNKPVCIDCHGVHDIKRIDDPNSTVIKENLLKTCRKCHPEATANFPAAWLSHYRPSPQHYPLVYYVNLFYKIFIPTVLGGMALFVISDAGRKIARRGKDK